MPGPQPCHSRAPPGSAVGEGFIPPGHFPPPQTATAARGLAALRPHLKSVRRAGCPHPAEACRQIPFTVQSVGEGFIPPGLCAHIAAQHKKAGANISFAPAVLLLRSHSLITLFVIFRTASTSSWESFLSFANFDCPFRILLTVHWTYPRVRYLLKSICGTE